MRTREKVILAGVGALGVVAAVAFLARRFRLVVMNDSELMRLIAEQGHPSSRSTPFTEDEFRLGRYTMRAGWPVDGVGIDFQTSAEGIVTVGMLLECGYATLALIQGEDNPTFQLVSLTLANREDPLRSLHVKDLPEAFGAPGLNYADFLLLLEKHHLDKGLDNGEA